MAQSTFRSFQSDPAPGALTIEPALETPAPASVPAAPSSFASFADGDDEQLARSVRLAQRTPAPTATRLEQLAQQTGLSVDVVSRHADEIERELAAVGFNAAAFRRSSPKLAQWLQEPRNAAIAHEDLPALGQIETTLTFGGALQRGIDQLQGMVGAAKEWAGSVLGSRSLQAEGRATREREAVEAASRGRRSEFLAIRGPWDLAQWVKETVGEQLPMMTPSLAGGATGALVGSVVPGVGTTIGAAIGAFVPSVVLGVGETQSTVKDIDPDSDAPLAVFIGGTAIGALDTVVPGKLGSKLVRTFGQQTAEQVARRALAAPVKAKFVRTVVGEGTKAMASEGLTEAVQEAIGAVAAAKGTGTSVPDDLWRQMVEAGAAGGLLGFGAGGSTAVTTFRRDERNRLAGEQAQAFYQGLAEGAKASALVKTMPQAAQGFIAEATKDGPVEHLYIPPEAFEYFQTKGISPELIARELTGREGALEEARQAGHDVVVRTAAYAVKVAPTEHHAALEEWLRLSPEMANRREIRASVEAVDAGAKAAAAVEPTRQQTAVAEARERVYAQTFEQLVAAGKRPEEARFEATLHAARFGQRAERLEVDPLVLAQRRGAARVVGPTSRDATRFTPGEPAAVQPGSPLPSEIAIPASRPPRGAGGESSEASQRRRTVHMAALSSAVVRAAQALDPNVDVDQVRQELEFRVAMQQEQLNDLEASGRDPGALLRAIAGYGGLWWEARTGGFKGEIEQLKESSTGVDQWAGVKGVFRKEGLTPDGMLEALRQDPEFQWIESINDLLEALDVAVRQGTPGAAQAAFGVLPGTDELVDLGIRLDRKWWGAALEPEFELEDTAADDGDASFNPDEFEQRVEDRFRELQPSPSFKDAVRPPIPFVTNADASQLWRAAGGHQGAWHARIEDGVPLSSLVATQDWVFVDTAQAYATGAREADQLPLAIQFRGRYYIANGHHRVAAAWANGATELALRVMDADPAAAREPAEFFQRGTLRDGDGYQTDLFGDVPEDPGTPAPGAQGAVRDVRSAGDALQGGAPELATRTQLVTHATRQLGASTIRAVADAAAAAQYLAKGAQERFDGIVTDAEGTPLAIVGSFKGSIDEAAAYPSIIVAEAFQVDGAAAIWAIHNHPSGRATLSEPDRHVARTLANVFTGSGIALKGFLVVGAGAEGERSFDAIEPLSEAQASGAVGAPIDGPTVPIVEREFVSTGKLAEPITSPTDAKRAIPELAGDRFGVVLADTQHAPIGFVPIDPAVAQEFRSGGRLDALYRALGSTATARAFIYAPDVTSRSAALNLANVFHGLGLSPLDIIWRDGGTASSWRESIGANVRGALEGVTGAFLQDDDAIRGAYNPDTNTIRLTGSANLSSFLHESGHAFLEDLIHDAATLDPTSDLSPSRRGVYDDALTALRAIGFEGTLEDWLATDVDGRRAAHERFAEMFITYLREGQAPSAELRQAFARFRAWLLELYRRVRERRVPINDEIRGVMDRMLASDAAIAEAEAEGAVVPLFTDAASAGVDALTFAAYQKQIAEASLAAREDIDRRTMAEWRRMHGAEWEAARERTRQAVVAEMMHQPEFVAQSVMRTGKMPDGSIPNFADGAPMKLAKDDVVRQFGAAMLKRLPRHGVGYLYSVKEGFSVDTLAELFGFGSGQALMEALVTTPRIDRVIEFETDRRVRESHGDPMLEGVSLQELAEGAVADHRAAVISAELKALTTGMAGAALLPRSTVQQLARTRIASTKVRELKPGLFLNGARRASQAAFDAFGRNDRAEAIRAKQQELVALELFRQARDAQALADRQRERLGPYYDKGTVRGRIGKAGHDYLEQIDAIRERYEFIRVTNKQLDRRQSLRKWVEKLTHEGLPVDLPDAVLDDARQVNWRELTVEELTGVYDAVEQVAHLAKLKEGLLKAQRARSFEEARHELRTSLENHAPRRPPTGQETRLPSQAAGKLVAGVFASHRKIASLAREMDGFEDGGAMWEYFIRPINEAGDREAAMNAEASPRLLKLFTDAYTTLERAQWYRLEHVPALGAATDRHAQLSKAGRLAVALNWGNETNRQRMRDGRGWTDVQVQAMLDTLDKRDWQFVQSVWDYFDSFRPAMAEKERRLKGIEPEWVEPTPVFTRFGEFRGGYYPIKFEGELSPSSAAHEDASIADMQKFAAYAPQTQRSHLKRRAEGDVNKAVRLDLGVVFEHVGQVIHDLTHHEMLVDVGRLLADEEIAKAIYDTHGVIAYRQFKAALTDIAVGDTPARHETEKVISHFRQGSTIVGLGLRVTTAALQPLGLTQSMARIGIGWTAKGLAKWLGGAVQMEHTVRDIRAQSTFMAHRLDTMTREINEIRNRVGVDQGRLSGWVGAALEKSSFGMVTKQGIADSYFYLIQRMQMVADVPTWLGAYEKAAADPQNRLEDGTLDEARIVALADQAVLDSQGGGQIKDLAAVQRGGPMMKLWTNFYSFFSTTFNLFTESYRRTKLQRSPAAVGRLAVDYLLLFAVPATLNEIMQGLLRGTDDEDDSALVERILRANASYMLGTMVLVRELSSAVQGYQGYEGPAGARVFASIGRLLRQVEQGDVDAAALKALNEVAGAVFHYPAGQLEKSIEGLIQIMEGESENPLSVIVGPRPK